MAVSSSSPSRLRGHARVSRGGGGGAALRCSKGAVAPAHETRQVVPPFWIFTVDLGRVKDTWMEPQWGAKGVRYEIPLAVELKPDGGVALPVAVGAYAQMELGEGNWTVDGSTFRMQLPLSRRYERGDVWLDEGTPLNFAVGFYPDACRIAQRGGRVTIPAVRWFVRREKRLVGTCVVRGPYATKDDATRELESSRVRKGDHDGRVYETRE